MIRALFLFLTVGWTPTLFSAVQPLQLHPTNPHYLLFRGKPTLFLTSGEHYGAVLNLDFDYVKYLDTLAQEGLNGTRTWSGIYYEPSTAFSISENSLAPRPSRFLCPWARSDQPGYADSSNKFDLTKWDPEYFRRLKDFLGQAGRRGIIVELNLFCPFYEEGMWQLSPLNAANNINGVEWVSRTNVYTLDRHGGLLSYQEAMVRKLVEELNSFDNLYYEICNEPYYGGVTLEWQHHIAELIVQTEQRMGIRHLISQNIANGSAKIEKPDPAVSIFNFHYANPPDTVAMNWGLNKVIGENETGFLGTNDAPYRMEAWDFLITGGGLYNNLDFSFTVGHENGTFVYPANQPGGGNAVLRRQLGYLRRFLGQFDFTAMHPQSEGLTCALPPGATIRMLAKTGQQYGIYVRTATGKDQNGQRNKTHFTDGELAVELTLPEGNFNAEWWDTKTGSVAKRENWSHAGGTRRLVAPEFESDVALAVLRRR